MSESPFKVTQLSELDLKGSPQAALKKCLELNIPVFIGCPKDRTLWAVPHDIEESISIIKNHRCSKYNAYFKEPSRPRPAPTCINSNALLLKLAVDDVKQLIMDSIVVVKSQEIYKLSGGVNEGFTSLTSLSALPLIIDWQWPDTGWYERNKEQVGLMTLKHFNSINIHAEYIARYFYFILCKISKSSLVDLEDPLNDVSAIKVNAEDCYIPNEGINQFTEYQVEDIPSNSPYYLPEDCRHSLLLNELAILGQKIYQDESIPLPSNLAEFLKTKLLVKPKAAATAAFFINPKPTAKMNDKGEPVLQFQNLIAVYKSFCLIEKPKLNKQISLEFKDKYGYSADNCDYAAALISPTK